MQKMKRLRLYQDEAGFIPMLLSIMAVVVFGIIFVYMRVQGAN
jgi:hypothetical protein